MHNSCRGISSLSFVQQKHSYALGRVHKDFERASQSRILIYIPLMSILFCRSKTIALKKNANNYDINISEKGTKQYNGR